MIRTSVCVYSFYLVFTFTTEARVETFLAVITSFTAKISKLSLRYFCVTSHYMLAVVYLVVHHPAHVFEVAIIEKCRAVELHPQTQLLHTDRADLWKHIAAQTHTQNHKTKLDNAPMHTESYAKLMSEKHLRKVTDIFSEKLL